MDGGAIKTGVTRQRTEFSGRWLSVHQVLRGTGFVTTDERTHRLVPDGYLVVNSGSPHIVQVGTGSVVSVLIDPALLPDHRFEECLTPRDLDVDLAFAALFRTGELHREGSRLAEALVAAKCGSSQQFFLAERDESSEVREWMRTARAYVLEHLGESLSVERLAQHISLSEFYFHRCFTAWHGVPPGRYIIVERIRRACRQLVLSDQSVAAVAEGCGYLSPTSFVRAFRGITGQSPTEFRERNLVHRDRLQPFGQALQSC